MQNYVASALNEYNLISDGNNAFGIYQNYEINAFQDTGSNKLIIIVSTYLCEAEKIDVSRSINAIDDKNMTAEPFDFGIKITLITKYFSDFHNRLSSCLNSVVNILKNNGAPGCNFCPISGNKIEVMTHKLIFYPKYGFRFYIDSDAAEIVDQILKKRKLEFDKEPKHRLAGLGGLFIGALVGSGLAFLFIAVDRSPIMSGFSTALGIFLYKKFKGREDAFLIIASLTISIMLILSSVIGSYIYITWKYTHAKFPNLNAFELFARYVSNSAKVRNIMIYSLVINFVEIIFSELLAIILVKKRKKANDRKIKKVNRF